MRLVDRVTEKQALAGVLESVRSGMSAVLVLRGEAGAGKTALLDDCAEQAGDLHVVRIAAAEAERNLGFAAIHQLLVPFLPAVDGLPEPQHRALGVAFGLVSGPPADPFLVGLAVLTLLSDAAETRPVLCVVDDAQWLDEESADLLSFVARRLLADGVGMLFAVREPADGEPRLQALPTLRVAGLPEEAAHELLRASIADPIDPSVAARIVAETGGNPLAVVAAARELTPEQLSGRTPLPEPLAVGQRLEASLLRRVRELPEDTQALLLLAAAGSPVQGHLLWRAAEELGMAEAAAVPAEAAGLVSFWPRVQFAPAMLRSAVYHAATARERRRAHLALAAAADPEAEAVPRAWHLAAAADRPDDTVAAELEAAAARTRSRGGYPATASLLERAAQLTSGRESRARREFAAAEAHVLAGTVDRADVLLAGAAPQLAAALPAAQALRLSGRIRATRGLVADAVDDLVEAARRLGPLDPRAARDAVLSALDSATFAGWAASAARLDQVVRVAQGLLLTGETGEQAATLVLRAFTARWSEGYAAAVPLMRDAVAAFLAEDLDPELALRRLELVAIGAADLVDDAAVERLTTRWVELARERGALTALAGGLAFRGAFVDAPSGRLGAAWTAEAEARELGRITHNPAIVPPTGAHRVLMLALSGREAEARETAAAVARDAPGRGAVGEAALASYGLGVLEIGLGNYDAAVTCLEPAYRDDTPLVGTQALPELVEAAARAGRHDLAEEALRRLDRRARATRTPLALGLLARARAVLADADDVGPVYDEALALLATTGAAPQLARTHLVHGEWLRRRRPRRAARGEQRTALDLFEDMGLEAFAERARVELRATGEHVRRRDADGPEELTPQEAQIAVLVSRGEANREIAAKLFISPSTVEYHLRKVFRKVGVTSRTQLANHVISQRMGGREQAAAVGPVDGFRVWTAQD